MGIRLRTIGLVIGLFSGSVAAEFTMLGDVPDTNSRWVLLVDTNDNSCMVRTDYVNDVRIGFISSNHGWAFLIGKPSWNIPEGSSVEAGIITDTDSWYGHFTPIGPGIIMIVKPEFISNLSRTSQITVKTKSGEIIGKFQMIGSTKAISAAGYCHDRLVEKETNPFGSEPPVNQQITTPSTPKTIDSPNPFDNSGGWQ